MWLIGPRRRQAELFPQRGIGRSDAIHVHFGDCVLGAAPCRESQLSQLRLDRIGELTRIRRRFRVERSRLHDEFNAA